MTLAYRTLGATAVGLVALLVGTAIAHGESVAVLQAAGAITLAAGLVAASGRPTVALPALAFVLGAFPVARLVVQGVPIYATDVLVVLLVVWAVRSRERLSGYAWIVVAYLVSWIPSWLHEVTSLHLVLVPTYGLLRNVVAVAAFFPAYLLARRRGADRTWIAALAVGTGVTALLALLQAEAPATGNRLLDAISHSFTTTALKTYPDRAFALFTAPTTLAGFLCVAILLFVAAFGTGRLSRRWLIGSTTLCTIGLLATYSRQWVPALAVGLLVLAALRLGLARRIAGAVAVTLAAGWLLLSTGTLNSSYLDARFSALGPSDVNVQSRVSRQRAFVELARREPGTFAIGKGFAGQDLVQRGLVTAPTADRLRAGLNDNVFLLEVFNHGIVAGVLYLGLVAIALVRVLRAARLPTNDAAVLAGIGAALAAAVVLQLSDNYFSEAVFMKTFLWLLIGTGIGLVERARAMP